MDIANYSGIYTAPCMQRGFLFDIIVTYITFLYLLNVSVCIVYEPCCPHACTVADSMFTELSGYQNFRAAVHVKKI